MRSCQTPPPFWKFGWRVKPSPQQKRGGRLHTMGYLRNFCCIFQWHLFYFEDILNLKDRYVSVCSIIHYEVSMKINKWRFVLIRYSWMLKLVFLIVIYLLSRKLIVSLFQIFCYLRCKTSPLIKQANTFFIMVFSHIHWHLHRPAGKGIGSFISTHPQTSRHLVTEMSTAYF